MTRFNRRGQEKVYLAPMLTDPAAPDPADVATWTELTPALRNINGFNYTGEDLDASDMSSTWGKTIPGGDTAGDSSMTFAEGDDDADVERDIEAALTKGDTGFIIFSPEGVPADTGRARVWPIRVKSNTPDESAENGLATFSVGYSIPDPPELEAVFTTVV